MYVLVALLVAAAVPACLAVTPVSSVNVTAYLGRWYQMYDNEFAQITTEPHVTWFGEMECDCSCELLLFMS